MSSNDNQRRDARLMARLPVILHRGKDALVTETFDVSFRGLFVFTPDVLSIRSLVRLSISLPHVTVETHGMVVHTLSIGEDDPGLGIQLWGLYGIERTAWNNFVRELAFEGRPSSAPPSGVRSESHPALTEPVTPSGMRFNLDELPFSRASNSRRRSD